MLTSYLSMFFVIILCFIVYFLPSFIAAQNKHRNSTAIGVLNLFVGWTFIGWVVALVWACTKSKE